MSPPQNTLECESEPAFGPQNPPVLDASQVVGLHIAPLSGGRCSASGEFTPECFALQKGSTLGVSKMRQGRAEVVARGGFVTKIRGAV